MAAALVLLLLLLPAAAVAQIGTPPSDVPPPNIYVPPTLYPNTIQPGAPYLPPGGVIEITPRTAPPPTIPSGPEIFLPLPTQTGERPRKTFDFRPSIGVVEEYTDNFNQVPKGAKSNLRSGVAPAFSLIFDEGPFSATAGYDLLAFYDTRPDDTGLHHNLAGLFTWQATPLFRLSLTEAFSKSDEPARADRLNLRQGREEFISNTTGLNADYLASFLQVGGYYRLSNFDSDTDRTFAHVAGVRITRPLGTIHSLTFGYEYLNTETESRPGTTTATTNLVAPVTSRTTTTTTGHQFTTTFTRDIRSDLSAGITGSYALRNQEQTHAEDTDFRRWNVSLFSNYIVPETIVVISSVGVAALTGGGSEGKPLVTTSSALTYWFGPATLSAALERGFSETFGTSASSAGVVETLGASASLSYRFTPLITGSVGLSYRDNKTTGVGGQSTSQTDETTIAGTVTLTYQILRWLVSSLAYVHTQVEPNDNTSAGPRGYKENRIRLSLSALFY